MLCYAMLCYAGGDGEGGESGGISLLLAYSTLLYLDFSPLLVLLLCYAISCSSPLCRDLLNGFTVVVSLCF